MTNQLIATHSTAAAPPMPPLPSAPAARTADAQSWLQGLGRSVFAELVGQAYYLQGYQVLPASGLGSEVDVVLTRDAERIFVHCGPWRHELVGGPMVRDALATVVAHHATWGIVATSGRFSQEAREIAQSARLTLLDGPAVLQLLAIGRLDDAGNAAASEPVPGPSSPVPTPSAPAIPPPARGRRSPLAASLLRGTAAVAAVALVIAGITSAAWSLAARLGPATGPLQPSTLQAVEASPTHKPVDIAYDPSDHRLYTAESDGAITIATTTPLEQIKHITIPVTPVSIASDGARHRAFVADGRSSRILVVDTNKGRVVATVRLSAKPSDLAFDPARRRLFVVSRTARTLSVVNTSTLRRLGSVPTNGEPTAVAVDSNTRRVYVTAKTHDVYSGITLHRLTSHTRTVAGSKGLAVDSLHGRLYYVRGASLMELNLHSGAVRRVASATGGASVTIDAPGGRLFVATPSHATTRVVTLR